MTRSVISSLIAAVGLFGASAANSSVAYRFTALSGGYNQTGSFSVTLPDFYSGASGGLFGYGAPLPVSSCQAATSGFAGTPAQSLQCDKQYFANDNTSGTMFSNNPGIYDVVLFSFTWPGNSPDSSTTFAYYFDKSAFENVGSYNSLVLGPSQAGTLNVSISAVPEAATWALMVAGFAAVGGMLRRRNAANRRKILLNY